MINIQFWYGVAAVLIVETLALMAAAAWLRRKVNRGKKKTG